MITSELFLHNVTRTITLIRVTECTEKQRVLSPLDHMHSVCRFPFPVAGAGQRCHFSVVIVITT